MDGEKRRKVYKIAAWSGVAMAAAGVAQTFTGYTSPFTLVLIGVGFAAGIFFHIKSGKPS